MDDFYTISKEIEFDAAHRLDNYEGKCSRLHGHRWKLVVKVRGGNLNDWGALIDFGDIKDALNEISNDFDHRVLLQDNEFNRKFNFPVDWVVWLPFNPTSENLAKYCYDRLADDLSSDGLEVIETTVFETPTSFCSYHDSRVFQF